MTDAEPTELRAGRYRVTGTLGEGSQGETLEAVDKQDGQLVAVKRFRIRGAKSWKDVELAEREARVLESLHHPALPAHVEHFEEDGCLYLVMERVEGESLAALRKRGGRLSAAQVSRLLVEASSVLDYLHGRAPPVIHRDIKPGNVLLRPDGSFALVDFGSVRDTLKPEGGSTVVGTFGYMAPEQFQGRALPQSDVYSVGATALALITGREPEDLPHKGLGIDVRAALGGAVDVELARVLAALVEPDPDKRPARIAPLLGRLHAGNGRREAAHGADARRSGRPDPTERAVAAAVGVRDLYHEFKDLKRQTRDAHERVREAAKESKRDRKRRRSDRRHQARVAIEHGAWQEGARLSPLISAVLLLGLSIAQVVSWALFTVLLPGLLTVLSVLFGSGLTRAAERMQQASRRKHVGLTGVAERLRGMSSERPDARVRVDADVAPQGAARLRVDATDGAPGDSEDEAESERSRAARRAER